MSSTLEKSLSLRERMAQVTQGVSGSQPAEDLKKAWADSHCHNGARHDC